MEAEHPTLLQVSRTHVLAILSRLFDSAEPAPLPLTRENLARCIGAPYGGGVVRGRVRAARPKAAAKQPGTRRSREAAARRVPPLRGVRADAADGEVHPAALEGPAALRAWCDGGRAEDRAMRERGLPPCERVAAAAAPATARSFVRPGR